MKICKVKITQLTLKFSTFEKFRLSTLDCMQSKLVYVIIAWVAVVFGINCVSNVGRKLVIVQGAFREQLIPNAIAT